MDTPRLAGRIALITGASRGIGASVAARFAAEGAKLVLAARTTGGLEEVDDQIRAMLGEEAAPTLVKVDLSRAEEIDHLALAISKRFGRLDILVGNAGLLGTIGPIHQIEPKEWDRVLAVNLSANWRLIRVFDPVLRAVNSGRAIFVSSGAAHGKRPYWGTYAVSKAGLEMMAMVWAAETEKTRLRVNVINPGATRTGMRAAAFPGENPRNLKPPEALGDLFVTLASPNCQRHGEVVNSP